MFDILTAAAGAANEPPGWLTFLPIVGMVVILYFLLFRPQMRAQKEHREKVASVKKGDQVVTAGGLIGKVMKVTDDQVEIELAKDVRVKAVKHTLGDIIPPGGTPAND